MTPIILDLLNKPVLKAQNVAQTNTGLKDPQYYVWTLKNLRANETLILCQAFPDWYHHLAPKPFTISNNLPWLSKPTSSDKQQEKKLPIQEDDHLKKLASFKKRYADQEVGHLRVCLDIWCVWIFGSSRSKEEIKTCF